MKTVAIAVRWSLLVAVTSAAVIDCARARGQDEGFKSLFNGKDLTDWKGDRFLVWTGGEPADFELRLKYKIVGGNSGVQYRSKLIDPEKYIVSGYQADIDSKPQFTGMNYEERARTFLARRGEKVEIAADGKKQPTKLGDADELQKKVKNEDWNDYTIVAKGNHLTHIINGAVMSEVIDNQKGAAAKSGVIALQLHTGPPMKVQFKDIQLKLLK
jgi:hypothetical protein